MATAFSSLEDAALVLELHKKQHALVRARFALSLGRLEDSASVGVIRKDIARIKTEVRRRELEAGLSRDELLRQHRPDRESVVATGEADEGSSGGLLSGVVDRLGA
jgi:large subunit ribosomal protein L29